MEALILSKDFKNSQTKDNLMRAFAGESQARNRYTFAASQAKKKKLYIISEIFILLLTKKKSMQKYSMSI